MNLQNFFESANNYDFDIGDPVIITGNVRFRGKTGDVKEFGRDGSFVVVDLYNHGPQSFQLSDVSYNDYAGSDDEQGMAEGLNEFAPGAGGDSGNYFQELARAWHNGTYNSASLQKGIKTKQDIERLLQRGIVAPDGVTRKYGIDYNADFDGVIISSDDYYEHGDYDDTLDSRTGQKWGPYDYMEFSDDDLNESKVVSEGAVKELSSDLKTMSDQEFQRRYKMTKAEARANLKKKNESRGFRGVGGARSRENDENDKIDAVLRQQDQQRRHYEQTGKFWIKRKDTQQHISDEFVGKAAANAAALDMLKQQPELRGNIVITAYGPGESQGVAEAGNKPLEKSRFGMGDTRTPRDIKSQMSQASDEFVRSTADKNTGPFHSKVAKMQGKMAKSELRRRKQGVAEGSYDDDDTSMSEKLDELLQQGMDYKQAVKLVAKTYNTYPEYVVGSYNRWGNHNYEPYDNFGEQGVAEGSSTNAEVTKQAKAAAQKAGKTFDTDVEYRLWYAITTQANAATRKADKKQGVAEGRSVKRAVIREILARNS